MPRPAPDPAFVAETDRIRTHRATAEARAPHPFRPARWTHPNGHPRCLLCGAEERIGGRCAGADHDGLRTTQPGARTAATALAHLHHELDVIELEAAVVAMAGEVERGVVPKGTRRPLHPHELAGAVNFQRIADDVDTVAASIAGRLVDARQGVMGLLTEYLDTDDLDELTVRVRALMDPSQRATVGDVIGVTVRQVEEDVGALLRTAATQGGATVLAELDDQRIPIPGRETLAPFVTAESVADIERQAARLAAVPLADLVTEVAEEYFRLDLTGRAAGDIIDDLYQHGRSLSPKPLVDKAKQAAHRAYGQGRTDTGASVPATRTIYASELLDGSTCGPCSLVDGRRYATVTAARNDYPAGRYLHCEGEDRCRGTLVFVWNTEELPTVDDAGDDPIPPTAEPAPGEPPDSMPPGMPPAPEALLLDTTGPAPAMPAHVLVDFKGFDPDTARELTDTVARLCERYPEIANRLGFLGGAAAEVRTLKAAGLPVRPVRGAWAYARDVFKGTGGRQRGSIAFNVAAGSRKNRANTLRRMADGVASGFHARGGGSPAGTIVHEFGHHVFYAIKRDAAGEWEAGVARRLGLDHTDPTWRRELARQTPEISKYATTNADERFAEAFVRALLDPDPPPIARAMIEEADKLYRARGVTP
jgi:hypothetical protein